ncbi:PKD domain-containing protein [Pseudoduganella violaceinigra]|uniref:PKD domain-containing protein n=1 Tax=Pseudoduganella violaceinigra TaxID=246602 RepID=UPI00041C858D|nr:PKD domain-containing protein [Pseudoduganella violaceinigra]
MHIYVLLALVAAMLPAGQEMYQPPAAEGARMSCLAPTELLIVSPAPDSVVAPQAQIRFEGSAFDCVDGVLAGDAIAWASDRDGWLGHGLMLRTAALSPGSHTVTMTATNSGHRSASVSVSLLVEEPSR